MTREAKRGRCIKRPGNTDTAKQAQIARLEIAVKANIQRKRIRPKKALHTKHSSAGRSRTYRTVQDGYGPGREKFNSFRTVQDEVVLKILGVYTLW